MRDAEEAPDPGRPDAAARVGAVVDRYTLTRLIGRGGMGAVYEARHAALSRRFAIKFLLPELAARPDMLRRFENEAKAAGGLEHPNVAAVMDFGRANDGAPYIVMEFLQGEDCARLLKRSGPLPVARAANIVVQACRGLDVAHANGIVHRDLKPENLFVSDAGDGTDLVKVLDFGIAKLRVADAGVATGTGATFGTAFYMSPEQARGAADVDPRTDVWSLGVVLYELLAGQRPFAGDQFLQVVHQILSVAPRPLGDLRAALPARLIAAIDRAMAKELSARWPTVLAFADALGAFAGGRAVTDPGPSRSIATAATPETMAAPSLAVTPSGATNDAAPVARSARPRARALVIAAGLVAVGLTVLVTVRRSDPVATTASVQVPVAQPVAPAAAVSPARIERGESPSGQSEHRPDSVPTPAPVRRKPVRRPPDSVKAPDLPAPRPSIDIEKDNPYGP